MKLWILLFLIVLGIPTEMKIKVKHEHWLPKILKVGGITIYPYILLSTSKENTPKTLYKHELIHCEQVEKMGWIWFYCSYGLNYVSELIKTRSHDTAYRAIIFEQEAYRRQRQPLNKTELSKLEDAGIKL